MSKHRSQRNRPVVSNKSTDPSKDFSSTFITDPDWDARQDSGLKNTHQMSPDKHSSRHFAPMWSEQMSETFGLFVVSTPIGHCEDITLRALETLKNVDGILCEDTRMTRTLLTHYGISRPCYSYHAHNERQKVPGIMHRLRQGDRLALVSDRGTPLISDPGCILIQACYAEAIPVHIIGGVSAVVHAFVGSGLSSNGFYFQGFMPTRKTKEHWAFLATLSVSMVFFIAPHDLLRFTKEALEALGPRPARLMRELTKKFEERVALPLDTLAQWIEHAPHLGECVMVIEGKSFQKRVAVSKYTKDAKDEADVDVEQGWRSES